MSKYPKFTRIDGTWGISVPIEYAIPWDRRIPVKRFKQSSPSFIQIADEPTIRKKYPSGVYDVYKIKPKPRKSESPELPLDQEKSN